MDDMPNPVPAAEAIPNGAPILVVDDDERLAQTVARALGKSGYRCMVALNGTMGLNLLHQNPFDLIITDLVMPGFDGIHFIHSVKAIDPTIPVIMMTGHGSIETAIEAIKAGAFHYLTKPVRLAELQVYVDKALTSREMIVEFQDLKNQLKTFHQKELIIGTSSAMRTIITQIEQFAPSTATVLITGETGTGKQLVAEMIHALSPRANRPLVQINCGALPESLLESELFGHVKGAFTSAYRDHQGRFELADGGTIFLDEIGEMSTSAQVRLLRVLQEGAFERVGGTKTNRVDTRVIAATNKDLKELVDAGKLRDDLYYRINVFHLRLPPLRERPADIPLLAQHFIHRYAKKNNKNVRGLGEHAVKALLQHPWSGNVRELENVIEHGVIMTRGDRITIDNLPDGFQQKNDSPDGNIMIPLGSSALAAEALVIQRTLEMTKGDKEAAAEILGFSTRTLYRKIREHNLAL